MHDYVNKRVPAFFDSTWVTNLEFMENINVRSMRRSGDLHIRRCRSKKLELHPLFRLPVLWNDFKEEFKGFLVSLDFKKELKTHLIKHLQNFECQNILCYACNN